jgi:glycerol-3-phosphate cytidylyltransferase-like family protein
MRQAKLCFPNVHLLIGVASDELCLAHKSLPALRHAERCESIKHCKWVDEVVPSCPWEITQEFIDEWEIDYVAHDEEAYVSAGKEDIYEFVKKQGESSSLRTGVGVDQRDDLTVFGVRLACLQVDSSLPDGPLGSRLRTSSKGSSEATEPERSTPSSRRSVSLH